MLIRNKFNGYAFDGSRKAHMDDGGGGGSATPIQQSVNSTQIPDYARPYVETMLGQAGALTDINQNPYQAYQGQRVAGFTPMQAEAFRNVANQQVAGQLGEASNLASQVGQTAQGAWGQGQQLGQAGLGYGSSGAGYGSQGAQLGRAGGAQYGGRGSAAGQAGQQIGVTGGAQYGGMGAGLGYQAAGAGQRYAQQATTPSDIQAYMNPYLQASLNPQLEMMSRQNMQTQNKNQAQAAAQGAFGGNRGALVQSQNQFYDALAKQQLIGQGYNTAFGAATQAQQFGANLGLQGLQTGIQGAQTGLQGVNAQLAGTAQGMQGADIGLRGVNTQLAGTAQGMQGADIGLRGVNAATAAGQYGLAGLGVANQSASTLGALGQTQFGQESAINQAMANAGAQQQALEQRGLENQYQDYLTQLNYPYQQLGFMSNMLRGVPLNQQSTAVYQAAPSGVSQLAGAGTALYGASRLVKKGGSIKEKKGSGLADLQLHKLVG